MAFEPQFRITPRMLRQLKAIEQTAGFLDAVRLRPEWLEEVRGRTQVTEAFASLQIEGNSLTLEQAFELAQHPPARELRNSEREFCNYLSAFEAIDGLRNERRAVVRRGDLCNLHQILLKDVRGGERSCGEFRKEDVKVGDVGAGEMVVHHQPLSWLQVDPEVESLLSWIEAGKERGDGPDDPWIHPVIQAGIAQHRLVWIHPFLDGNGRTARMFTSLLLFQRGYDFKYLFELSAYYNQNRDKYYRALRTADTTGDYTDWLIYFLGGFACQMVDIQALARGGER
jgi:Fic family protein